MAGLMDAIRGAARRMKVLFSGEKPATPGEGIVSWLGGGTTKAGVQVDEWKALNYTTFYACVRIISENIGQLPLLLYQRRSDGGRDRATNHPLFDRMKTAPNGEMSAAVFRETMQAHILGWGNGRSQIVRDRRGRVLELWPLRPDRTTVKRAERSDQVPGVAAGERFYEVTHKGRLHILPADQVFDVHGLGFDGIRGYSPLALFRESIALGLAQEEYAERFYGQGTHPAGILKHPGNPSDEQAAKIKKDFASLYSTLGKSHGVLFAPHGMDFEQITINPADAMLLDARRFQVAELSRIFNVPMHMLSELDRATHSNIEQSAIEFVRYCLGPWLVRWEGAANMQLLTAAERSQGYYFEFMVDALLRADLKTRYDAYAVARQWGWTDADEIRQRENQDNLPNGIGKIVYMPLNMVPLSAAQNVDEGRQAEPGLQKKIERAKSAALLLTRGERRDRAAVLRERLRRRFGPVLLEGTRRLVNKETLAVGRKIEQMLKSGGAGAAALLEWLDEFYGGWGDEVAEVLRPAVLSFGEARAEAALSNIGEELTDELRDGVAMRIEGYVKGRGANWAAASAGQLRALIEEAQAAADAELMQELLTTRVDEWKEKRPEKEKTRLVVTPGERAAWVAWSLTGITQKIWETSGGESCPLCDSMDGKVVGIEKEFAAKGSEINPGGGTAPLTVRRNVTEPQLHGGCVCGIRAVMG